MQKTDSRIENWNGRPIRFVERGGEWWAVAKDVKSVAKTEGHDWMDIAGMISLGYLPLNDFLKNGEFIKEEVSLCSAKIALTATGSLLYITHWYGDSECVKIPNIATNFANIVCQQDYKTALENWLSSYELFFVDPPDVVKEIYKALGKKPGDLYPINHASIEVTNPSEFAGVYLVQAENGLVKIGCTKNIKQRFLNLKTSSPCGIKLIGFYKCQNYYAEESLLHKQFADKREIGEWFKLDESELMALNERFSLGLSVSERVYQKYARKEAV